MCETTYCSIEIEDVAFAQIPKINCYLFHQFGCRLEDALWQAYDELTPRDTEGGERYYENIYEDGYWHEEELPF